MVSPVNNSSANAALRSGAQPTDAKRKPSAGELPYTRSTPPRTSMESPHVPGAAGRLGQPSVHIDPNGFPTHLLFNGPNGPGVAVKVKRDEAAPASDAGVRPHASAPSPHVAGARGEIGNPKVGVDPRGVPDHLLAVQNGELVLAQKVKHKAE